jgi:hypothetical protein
VLGKVLTRCGGLLARSGLVGAPTVFGRHAFQPEASKRNMASYPAKLAATLLLSKPQMRTSWPE